MAYSVPPLSELDTLAAALAASAYLPYHTLPDPLGLSGVSALGARAAAAAVNTRMIRGPRSAASATGAKFDGRRALTALDTWDELALRCLVGDVLLATNLADQVAGHRTDAHSRHDWTTRNPGYGDRGRRSDALETLLAEDEPAPAVLLKLDLASYFPSVDLARLPEFLPGANLGAVRHLGAWLGSVNAQTGLTGLPIGPEGCAVLGTALLAPLDELLTEQGVRWVRYVDDIWCLAFDVRTANQLLRQIERAVWDLGFDLNYGKTELLEGGAAIERILDPRVAAIRAAHADGDTGAAWSLARTMLEAARGSGSPDSMSLVRYALRTLSGDPQVREQLVRDTALIEQAGAAVSQWFAEDPAFAADPRLLYHAASGRLSDDATARLVRGIGARGDAGPVLHQLVGDARRSVYVRAVAAAQPGVPLSAAAGVAGDHALLATVAEQKKAIAGGSESPF